MLNYFHGKLNNGFMALYSGRMILRTATNLLGIFLPIFLYELFAFNVKYVIIYYLIGHIAYALSVAWGCKFLNLIGLRRSLRITLIFGAMYYFAFYLLSKIKIFIDFNASDKQNIFLLLAISLFLITIHRIMYWTPVHTDMAKFMNKKNRAKQLSLMEATTAFLGAVGPILAGLILMKYNYNILFIIAIVCYLSALIPFMYLPRTKERFSWTYKETWQEFFSKKRRKAVLAFLGDGAEAAVGIVIWPIFIFEVLKGNYLEVGAISSLVVLVTIILQLFIGKFVDGGGKRKMIHWGSALYAFGWFIKIFVLTAFQIFVVSIFHNFTKIFARTPFDALTYEKAADQGHFVDEFTVIHEMAIQFGKGLMLIFILILISFISLEWTFLFAAIASLAMNFLADEKAIKKGRHSGSRY
ncbi:MAG: MFS transporter [Patescibacteria group bacterium]|nr:MFS transporter [Patescibacteria group bacterium]